MKKRTIGDKKKKSASAWDDVLIETEAEEIGFADLVRKAVDRIHYLLAAGKGNPSVAIHGLKQMMSPYFDEEYRAEYNNLCGEKEKETNDAKDYYKQFRKNRTVLGDEYYNMELFGMLIRMMARQGLLLKETMTEEIK